MTTIATTNTLSTTTKPKSGTDIASLDFIEPRSIAMTTMSTTNTTSTTTKPKSVTDIACLDVIKHEIHEIRETYENDAWNACSTQEYVPTKHISRADCAESVSVLTPLPDAYNCSSQFVDSSATTLPVELKEVIDDTDGPSVAATPLPIQLKEVIKDTDGLSGSAAPLPTQLKKVIKDADGLSGSAAPLPVELKGVIEYTDSVSGVKDVLPSHRGWTILPRYCPSRTCGSIPLRSFQGGPPICIVCGRLGSDLSECNEASVVLPIKTPIALALKEPTPTVALTVQPPRESAVLIDVPVTVSDAMLVVHSPTDTKGSTVSHDVFQNDSSSVQSDEKSLPDGCKEIYKRLKKGWVMNGNHCENCTVPLVTRNGTHQECVICGPVRDDDDDSSDSDDGCDDEELFNIKYGIATAKADGGRAPLLGGSGSYDTEDEDSEYAPSTFGKAADCGSESSPSTASEESEDMLEDYGFVRLSSSNASSECVEDRTQDSHSPGTRGGSEDASTLLSQKSDSREREEERSKVPDPSDQGGYDFFSSSGSYEYDVDTTYEKKSDGGKEKSTAEYLQMTEEINDAIRRDSSKQNNNYRNGATRYGMQHSDIATAEKITPTQKNPPLQAQHNIAPIKDPRPYRDAHHLQDRNLQEDNNQSPPPLDENLLAIPTLTRNVTEKTMCTLEEEIGLYTTTACEEISMTNKAVKPLREEPSTGCETIKEDNAAASSYLHSMGASLDQYQDLVQDFSLYLSSSDSDDSPLSSIIENEIESWMRMCPVTRQDDPLKHIKEEIADSINFAEGEEDDAMSEMTGNEYRELGIGPTKSAEEILTDVIRQLDEEIRINSELVVTSDSVHSSDRMREILSEPVVPFFQEESISCIGIKLTQGWTMHDASCAFCSCPLMGRPNSTNQLCINPSCTVYRSDDDDDDDCGGPDDDEFDFLDDDPEAMEIQKRNSERMRNGVSPKENTNYDVDDYDKIDALLEDDSDTLEIQRKYLTSYDPSNSEQSSRIKSPEMKSPSSYGSSHSHEKGSRSPVRRIRKPPSRFTFEEEDDNDEDDDNGEDDDKKYDKKYDEDDSDEYDNEESDDDLSQVLCRHLEDSFSPFNQELSPLSRKSHNQLSTALTSRRRYEPNSPRHKIRSVMEDHTDTDSVTSTRSMESDSITSVASDAMSVIIRRMDEAKTKLKSSLSEEENDDDDSSTSNVEAQMDMALLLERLASAAKAIKSLEDVDRQTDVSSSSSSPVSYLKSKIAPSQRFMRPPLSPSYSYSEGRKK